MALSTGARVGPYEVVSKLGEGGMGQVYRARDTRLDRDVALKSLPDSFADDPDRLSRFEREAKILAALNHPHIAHVYGLEIGHDDSGSPTRALVMELVEGEDLSQRIARGPLPLDEALAIARQIAEALEAAHDAGIVHRDLKPANIKLRQNGAVKVLDFGLAKMMETADSKLTAHDVGAHSPTISVAGTRAGVILGTAAYMSPEQARGKVTDTRADIWAFGCVLYEMLAGKTAFGGETVTDILAALVHKEPDWTILPASVPTRVRDVIEHCLRKDPARRYHHMADVRIVLDDAHTAPRAEIATTPKPSRRSVWPAIATAVIAAAVALAVWAFRPVPPSPVYAFTIPTAGFNTVSKAAISHDGKWIVYSPNVHAAPFKLLIRGLDSFDRRELVSTDSTGYSPFFSPDDRWIGYYADSALFKVPAAGGAPERVATVASAVVTGSWGPDGTIVISGNFRVQNSLKEVLASVPASGGEVSPITNTSGNEAHLDPEILPDGKTVLFTIATPQGASIAAVPLRGGPIQTVLNDARTPKYSKTGHLVFQRPSSGDLMGVPFDPSRLETSGEVTRLSDVVQIISSAGFAVSSNGTLIYSTADDTSAQDDFIIVSVDRSGTETPILAERGSWAGPRFSPDGRTVLYRAVVSPNCDVWTVDIARGTRSRVTFEGDNHSAIWRSDGQISWATRTTGPYSLRMARADRPAQVTALSNAENERFPESWSRDNRYLLFTETRPTTGRDLLLLDAASNQVRAIAASRFSEGHGEFSPDGGWIAYVSNESGRNEVYIQRTGDGGGRVEISANGGDSPVWSRDGKELFYVEGPQLMVVDIDTRAAPARVSRPRVLLRGPYVWERPLNYDVSQDGRRFLMVRRQEGSDPSATLRVIVNWPARIR